ncbi:maleylpyruvate isomerase family mycothiol-dependent enzyme [Nocardia cyriacigeorgica]|uniref:maleylpyruvate isomerase family mycothiol-dependent enzyme n=1 Tax=Nocardia cyriacigeorgica TaxID=135487 RepID=UPI002493707F|nr:maleylpyruvate isomerase family mycothiol-dependent enzyme [Nocardia cyriacigeorgica]BDT85161.1 hypothetical protein FMUAM8_09250 [Nocardia cyriacigeorgica]
MSDIWPIVHAERVALIDDLAELADDLWERPSLCGGWTVHDVAAHLINNAKATRLGIVRDMVRARFDFARMTAQGVERERDATPRETLARLRKVATLTSTPPAPLDSRLVEEVVHGEDIRRPLGIKREYSAEAVVRSLRYQAHTPVSLGGAKQLVSAVRLCATDEAVSIGDGPEISGPALSLLLAISGRKVALSDLTGPGLRVLD